MKKIWEFLEWPCGERLKPYLPEIIPKLEKFGNLLMSSEVRGKLLAMSISTIDRLLRDQRKIRRRKFQCTTKPGTLLKHQIPVRKELWPADTVPGFGELDLVAHCGMESAGEYLSTLSYIDIATTWIEHAPVLGKSQKHTREALETIKERLPFQLHGIDPDNGSEFINYHLKAWCDERDVLFTRSRPYRKNDNAHIEQKNWSTVRQVLGYQRLTTERQKELMERLYAGPLRDWQNFFQPTLKLKEKIRRGARLIKRHDTAKTPYQRVLESSHVSAQEKAQLKTYYERLNPVVIKKEIAMLIEKIFILKKSPRQNGKKRTLR